MLPELLHSDTYRIHRVNIQNSLSILHCSLHPKTIKAEISANKQHLASPEISHFSKWHTTGWLLIQSHSWKFGDSHLCSILSLQGITQNPPILRSDIYPISSTKPTQIYYYNNLSIILTLFLLIHFLILQLKFLFNVENPISEFFCMITNYP